MTHPPSARNPDVCVVVRCLNEAPVVRGVIEEPKTAFDDVVGVDDGSTDASAREMSEAGATVVRHAMNLGAGAALQTGIEYALRNPATRFVLTFDADGQHRVADALAMVARSRAEDLDFLIGSRFLGEAPTMSRGRRAVLRAGAAFERMATGIALSDGHNGLRVFSRAFAEQVDLHFSDMAYASELVRFIRHTGATYGEHPVTIDYTDYSRAKGQRSINSINIGWDVLMHDVLRSRRR